MRAISADKNAKPRVTLPEFVKGVKLDDLYELCINSSALSGMWEKSQSATTMHKQHVQLASQNEEHAEKLTRSIAEIEELREEISCLAGKERTARELWQAIESAMYTTTKRYSPAGIRLAIEKDVVESDRDASRIDNKLRDGLAFDEDPIALAKQYVGHRREYYYKKSLLESLS